jgi:hypothetical protein
MPSAWKVISGSAVGTSHLRSGEGCQDCCSTRVVETGDGSVAILAAADGAGSAPCADTGARLACQTFLTAARAQLESGVALADLPERRVRDWVDTTRQRIALEACVTGRPLGDFACTLLAVVANDDIAVVVQIGDGAVVARDRDGYGTVVWPQSGEYANTTNFLTGAAYASHLQVRFLQPAPSEFAVLTDGLQPLALHYQSRSVHAPFFEPLFATLRTERDPDRLSSPLLAFLNSDPVNARTDDDKTLILASRRPIEHGNE